MANGNVSPLADKLPHEAPYREHLQLFRNRGDRTFDEVARAAGLNDGPLQSRRGVAFGDLNNDGLIDAVIYNVGRPPTLFVNETHTSNHSVLTKLVGVKSNRDAVGARVTIQTSTMTQSAEVHAGGSYLSSNDHRIHFGLGSEGTIEKLTIRWPTGNVEVLTKLRADSIYTIVEGRGIQSAVALSPVEGAPKAHSTTPKHYH